MSQLVLFVCLFVCFGVNVYIQVNNLSLVTLDVMEPPLAQVTEPVLWVS